MRTALYEWHRRAGAKIVNFHGWEMPIQYSPGILEEHRAVRQAAGLFDVSHMGVIEIQGAESERFLDWLLTNQVSGKKDESAIYGVLCNASGGSVDDVIVYKATSKRCLVVVNAGNREKDLAHLRKYRGEYDVTIKEHYETHGIIALQGPVSEEVAQEVFPEIRTLKRMHFLEKDEMIVARTGYTGENGFEFIAPHEIIVLLWEQLLAKGKAYGVLPVGLGARDTLRLEMGFALYGHELSEMIAPTESVSKWTVKWDKPSFLGKEALIELEKNPKKRSQYGFEIVGRGIPREGYGVYQREQKIGVVTSGTFSPTLKHGIGILLANQNLEMGSEMDIEIRGQKVKARITPLPFYRQQPTNKVNHEIHRIT